MQEAIGRFVQDGDTIVIEGFTHLICFAAGHEIIRQKATGSDRLPADSGSDLRAIDRRRLCPEAGV